MKAIHIMRSVIKAVNIIVVLMMVLNLFSWGATRASAEEPNPWLDVWFEDGNISAYNWPTGTQLDLTIEDPTTIASPDYSATTESEFADWDPTQTVGSFNLPGPFQMTSGMTVTVTGASLPKSLLIANLTITSIDPVLETITGGIDPSTDMWIYLSNTTHCCRGIQPSGNIWSVDYSVAGVGESTEDIRPGSGGTVNASDEDGDNTSLNWYIPNPRIDAHPGQNWVNARDWPDGHDVTLTINDPSNGVGVDKTVTTTVGPAQWNPNDIVADFNLEGYDLQGGDILHVTDEDGPTERTYTTTTLAITGYDLTADTLTGTATPNAEVEICAYVPGNCISRLVTANGTGVWTANYSGSLDLKAGSDGDATERDANGNQTHANWWVPNPHLDANPGSNWVNARDWPDGTQLTLTIDNPSNGVGVDKTVTTTVGPAQWNPNDIVADFNLEGYDLQGGDILHVTDPAGISEVTYIPTNITVTGIDVALDTVTGTTTPNAAVQVCANIPGNCISRYITANAAGVWTADYHNAGPLDDDKTLVDLKAGSDGGATERDANGNQTHADWRVPNPYIETNPGSNWVHARDWPDGTTSITVTIDDPATPAPVDFTTTALYSQNPGNPGDPNDWLADFNLGSFDLKAGFTITMSAGTTLITYVPTNLAITGFDLTEGTISGTGETGVQVQVCANKPGNCASRYVTPVAPGNWTVDYSNIGTRNDEQDIVVLQPGSNGWATQTDANGNQTNADWRVANPHIVANPGRNWVNARDWPNGTQLTLTIDDPSNGAGVDKTVITTVGPATWDPNDIMANFDLGSYDLQGGHILHVTNDDGTIQRTYTPTNLSITNYDLEADTLTGLTNSGANVQVCVNTMNNCVFRYKNPDGEGNWTVDYHQEGPGDDEQDLIDLHPGSDGWAAQRDNNGNQTQADWRIPNPFMEANPGSNWLHARDWPDGTTIITVTIDDPATPAPVDFTTSALYSQNPGNPGDPNDFLADFNLGNFDLKAGFTITMSAGTTLISFAPNNFAITGFDLAAGTISGIGAPNLDVHVCAFTTDYCISRYATSNAAGNWTVDYSQAGPSGDEQELVDLQPGGFGWAYQRDGSGNQTWANWQVPNPYISDISNQTTNENIATGAIAFTIADSDPAATLTVTTESSNTALVPNANITLGGSGENRTITLTPAANQRGTTTITVTVSNGTDSTSDTFVLTVNSIPVITEGLSANVTISQDGSPTAFSLTLHATDLDGGDTLTWSISGPASHGAASAAGTGTSKSIGYVPTLHYHGTDSFVVQVSDGHGITDTITVNVTITQTSFFIFLPITVR